MQEWEKRRGEGASGRKGIEVFCQGVVAMGDANAAIPRQAARAAQPCGGKIRIVPVVADRGNSTYGQGLELQWRPKALGSPFAIESNHNP
jgi:hypothetical protein